MNRRLFISASMLGAAATGLLWRARTTPVDQQEDRQAGERLADGRYLLRAAATAFDTSVSICVLHHDPAPARAALSRALAAVVDLDARLTVQRPGSQVARLNADGRLDRPDADLRRVLGFALQLAGASEGAFDPTVQPLWDLHHQCQQLGRRPSRDQIDRACQRVDWRSVDLDARGVTLAHGASITLNGLVQGYAADVAFSRLADDGITDALIDAGEFGSLGSGPAQRPWRVGIQHPRIAQALIGAVRMDGRFLATSGDYATRFTDDYSSHHIFDPHTGESPAAFSTVAVAASSGLVADGLTKPMMVLDLPSARALLDRFGDAGAGAGAVWVDKSSRIVAQHRLSVEPA
jgi:thiamine biosynthesis lipoprotein